MTDNEINQFWRDIREHNATKKRNRIKMALSQISEIRGFCTAHGYTLVLHNDNTHWHFKSRAAKYSWWPSTGSFFADGYPETKIYLMNLREVVREIENRAGTISEKTSKKVDGGIMGGRDRKCQE
jgi:hypothetical protein